MKYAFLFFACLGSTIITHAQISSAAADQNCINIIVSNNSMSIAFKSKEVAVHSNQALDSCLQKIIPDLNHPTIVLDTPDDIDQEKRRLIGVILEKFYCPVMSFRKRESINPPTTERLDTASH